MKRFPVYFVFILSGLFTLYGCAEKSSSTIKIGCAAPLTGDQAQIGTDVCRGVELAVHQAREKGDVLPGYKLEILSLDDQHSPAQAVNVAKKFVSDPDVVAVVGHFNSSCTKPASAVYHEARMIGITPGSTNPELSKQGFDTFFRVTSTDDIQGPKGAKYAAKTLGIKKVFIIDDKTTYGKGIADEFEKEARKSGIEILGHEGITQGDKDFTPTLTKIKPLGPDMIYFGGIYPEGALLVRQARSLDIAVPFMGGDGLATPIFIELASPAIAEGTYATMVGGDMKKLPSAAQFVADYEAKYGEIGQWSAYGYDAANIVIGALQKAGKKDRQATLQAIRQIPSFQGVTGEITFDETGDNKNQFIGIFKVEGGKLNYIGPSE
ncbi:MAG: branched-chain amino acid ABC transporter substrate-binding protein [Candidatus Omnitrophica bacterium]|nr:branched-chain amino acid ABC transporter substrate-binding protein [Candidatus Omnitrophota bacterium]